MKSRLASTAVLASFAALAFAAPALAAAEGHDNGEGLLGETNDRIVTFFSLGVVLFFFLVVCIGSYIQSRLDKRKEARKASDLRQRIGW